MNFEIIYKEHEKIGFPAISEKEQADILIWRKVEIINKLTPNFDSDCIPPAVAEKYVNLSRQKFKEFFIKSGYLENLYDLHLRCPKLDSTWVEKSKNSKYVMKVQEREYIVYEKDFENFNSVVDYFVDKLYKRFK